MLTCGMPRPDHEAFFSPETDPIRKWELLEPYWPRIRNTGYAQAVEIAARKLYGVEGLSRETIGRVQDGYRRGIKPGLLREGAPRGRGHRVVPGELPRGAVQRDAPAHAPDAGHLHPRPAHGSRRGGLRDEAGDRGPGPGRLAPGDRLVVRDLRPLRGGGEEPGRVLAEHRLRRRRRRRTWRTSSGRRWAKDPVDPADEKRSPGPPLLVLRPQGDGARPAGQDAHRLLRRRQLHADGATAGQRRRGRPRCAAPPPTRASSSCTSTTRSTRT